MFIGAMIAGPLGGYLMKKVDTLLDGHIPSGFEMLVNNFSAGILGAILACVGCLLIEPACVAITSTLSYGVNWLVETLLASVDFDLSRASQDLCFLNNALNHGIFTLFGMETSPRNRKIDSSL
ncbi:PTS transporter subunit EIIC [Dubosiella newyorkensis]|uniref:PTS transporter subunit EIIC n=1 Tax=Dubosiella newyorkensis TaxID=1862672 RepID=UPI003F674723